MEIAIATTLIDEIVAHAKNSPDREVCGLLLGDERTIAALAPATNVAPDPCRHFELDPAALIAAHKAARAGGHALIGHYHSHPSGDPTPSSRDAADAAPGLIWLIAAGDEVCAWRAVAGGPVAGMFEPVRLIRA